MKAVIPAAGLGTRFLPLTKNAPKEMLPLIDKPAIQYVVEEAVESGCDDILIITGRGKTTIEDHFDKAPELEHVLEERGDEDLLREVREIADLADIHYIRQKEPLGLGHAVLHARKHVGDEPFAVLLGDDIVFNTGKPCTEQLVDVYEETGSSVIAVEPITPEETEAYGVVDVPEDDTDPALQAIDSLVEKPAPADAPSHLGILGRYVLTPEVFEAIEETPPGVGDEIQLTDALGILGQDQDLYSYAFDGKRYDLGNKSDWLKTNIEVALMHKRFRDELRPFLEELVEDGPPALVG
jgi:UTP--glucose-1-phosphate uridylyltransferase